MNNIDGVLVGPNARLRSQDQWIPLSSIKKLLIWLSRILNSSRNLLNGTLKKVFHTEEVTCFMDHQVLVKHPSLKPLLVT
jgi:hypothetical protein